MDPHPHSSSPPQTGREFYEGYFSGVDHAEQRYDVGTWATRHFIRTHLQENPKFHLDIGCGDGQALHELKPRFRIGMEYSRSTLLGCRPVVPQGTLLVQGSATALPFKNQSIDAISSLHVIEHIEKDDLMMKEVARTLSTGGRFVIVTPGRANGIPDEEERQVNGHYRRYNLEKVRSLMDGAKPLKTDQIICAHRILGGIWNRLKWVFRYTNYPFKRWIFRDGKSIFQRRIYQKIFLPAVFSILETLDCLLREKDRYPWEGERNNFLMVWMGHK